MNLIGSFWLTLYIVPAIFWFFLVRKFNQKAKAKFPALLYSIFYLIPAINLVIAWSFISDVQEYQNKLQNHRKIPKIKVFLFDLALPYLLLSIGSQLFLIIGSIILAAGIPFLGSALLYISNAAPFIGFIWFVLGFWSLSKTIDSSFRA